jgi:pimeloyl-ACP methyl ester carboxylesterase
MPIKYQLRESNDSDGPVFVLIHGMGSASNAWKPLLPELENYGTILLVDLPGHGGNPLDPEIAMDPASMANAIADLISELNLPPVHLIGNSLGGWIALELAAAKPDLIASVTGLAPAGLWLTPFLHRIPGTDLSKRMAKASSGIAPTALKSLAARRLGFSRISPHWEEMDYQTLLDAVTAMSGSDGYYPAWDATLNRRFDSIISDRIPTTIVFGDSDFVLPERTCQERSLAPAHAKWIVLEKVGHAPMWDEPSKVVKIINETVSLVK